MPGTNGLGGSGGATIAEGIAVKQVGDLSYAIARPLVDEVLLIEEPYFERAVAQYDKVLKVQPFSLEAVNNKAWILHSYLDRSQEALELAKGIVAKVDGDEIPELFGDVTKGNERLRRGVRPGSEGAPDTAE